MSNAIFNFTKDPEEYIDLEIEFKNSDKSVTYNISALTVKVYDKTGTDVSDDIIWKAADFAGNKALIYVKGGENKKTYKIETLATMATGQRLMKKSMMTVVD